ncbi:hypothetical protein K402DRAFT_443554 [Aulographum hederae CBS 113979]|uniref:GET complex, subunit GET2 n=1 Tax=Aulographum hederae CBS 113979 TaxID=1176131 RepID=A0A6G1HDP3_9PEZI|nr:hypothetical protein K402DRAFT_443554 [Aulographum hederae CBS 113979]
METPPETESPAQKRARLQREKRNAKLATGAQSRLDAITKLSGRNAPPGTDIPPPSSTTSTSTSTSTPTPAGDPDEVDISQHYYTPTSSNPSTLQNSQRPDPSPFGPSPFPPSGAQDSGGNEDPMLRMLQQMMGSGGPGGGGMPGMPSPGQENGGGEQDPMMAMLQQMMGSGAGGPGGPGSGGGMPDMASMFSGMGGADAAAQAPNSAYLWRIVHFLVSLVLACYISWSTAFTGSQSSRRGPTPAEDSFYETSHIETTPQRLFYLFATFEIILQTSRYFVEKGQVMQPGILGTMGRMLPPPWGGYVRVLGRYGVIYTTVVADAMVVVFVLGVVAWWRGNGV